MAWSGTTDEVNEILELLRKDIQTKLVAEEDRALIAEMHEAHGVLSFLNHDYVVAADHFADCLRLNPHDAGLWNKLGATCANGGKYEDAREC